MRIKSKYGYKIGDKALTLIPVMSERGDILPKGTELRIVAIAPKVRIIGASDNAHATTQTECAPIFAQ